jgi:glycosyltransferase involved in cell wall biosynthesis
MLLGLFPELKGAGGIQRACRHVAAVLARWTGHRSWAYRFLSLNDAVGCHRDSVGGAGFDFEGFARHKSRYTLAAASAAMRRPKLIFAAHPNLAPLARVLKRLTGARMAVVGWGIEVWEPLPRLRQSALRAADLLLPISNFTAERMIAVQKVSPAAIRLLPLGLEPAFWDAAAQSRLWAPPPGFPAGRVLLSVTRLAASEGYKGVDTVIRALPRIAAAIPDAHYVIVGDGDDLPRLRAMSQERGVADRVHFLGRLSPLSAELLACYANCDVFVLPSKGEGFGLVFLEAMALGKPVIGGAHGGTPDIIQDGETGYLVPHGDVARLVDVLARLLREEPLRTRMGQCARQRVADSYLFEQFQARLTGILQETCAS